MQNSRKLPQPQTDGGMPLMQALKMRRTVRSFSKSPIDDQTLSNLLWATYGVADREGHRTIPTARNQKDLELYVADTQGIWFYDADNNLLSQVCDQNILELFNSQEFVADASLELIFVGSIDGKFADMHAGSAYQNASLYASSIGLNNVVRDWVDREPIAKAMELPGSKKIVITHAFG